jgi:hypothetical protein
MMSSNTPPGKNEWPQSFSAPTVQADKTMSPALPSETAQGSQARRTSIMAQPSTRIHVEHHPAVHAIDTGVEEAAQELTLLELIDAVSEVSETEQEVIATVSYMLNSGRVRLAGNFRDEPVAQLCG